MPTVVTTNRLGVDLFAADAAISASTPEIPALPHEAGARVTANDSSEWIYAVVEAGATINQNDAVTISRTGGVIPCARGSGITIRTRRLGVYQGATQLTAGMGAWFMISGAPQVKISGGPILPGATLWTSDVSGVLTSFAAGTTATASQFPVPGIHPTVTASGTTASAVAAIMTFPTIGALGGTAF
jgi:hypothetical protein